MFPCPSGEDCAGASAGARALRCCKADRPGGRGRQGICRGWDALVGESHWELAADEIASKSRPVRLADN
jgi:hypothetical protein